VHHPRQLTRADDPDNRQSSAGIHGEPRYRSG
jgi:hypothetical protein